MITVFWWLDLLIVSASIGLMLFLLYRLFLLYFRTTFLENHTGGHLMTAANVVTVIGCFLAAYSFYCLNRGANLCALILFLMAAVSDWLDGWLARYVERRRPGRGLSAWGAWLDPLRDKLLVLLIFPLSKQTGLAWFYPASLSAVEIFLVPIFAYLLSREVKKTVIIRISRLITYLQFLLFGFWLALLSAQSLIDNHVNVQQIIVILLVLSFARAFFYADEWYRLWTKQ